MLFTKFVTKLIYGAVTLDDAEYCLLEFNKKWGKKYPQIIKFWRSNWVELLTYFKYPKEVHRLIYTTNAVKGFHRMLRYILCKKRLMVLF